MNAGKMRKTLPTPMHYQNDRKMKDPKLTMNISLKISTAKLTNSQCLTKSSIIDKLRFLPICHQLENRRNLSPTQFADVHRIGRSHSRSKEIDPFFAGARN